MHGGLLREKVEEGGEEEEDKEKAEEEEGWIYTYSEKVILFCLARFIILLSYEEFSTVHPACKTQGYNIKHVRSFQV